MEDDLRARVEKATKAVTELMGSLVRSFSTDDLDESRVLWVHVPSERADEARRLLKTLRRAWIDAELIGADFSVMLRYEST